MSKKFPATVWCYNSKTTRKGRSFNFFKKRCLLREEKGFTVLLSLGIEKAFDCVILLLDFLPNIETISLGS